MSVIVKNVTSNNISINDLTGQVITPNESFNLLDYYGIEKIHSSVDLVTFVTNGSLLVNDGTVNLSVADGLDHIKYCTIYEAKKYFNTNIANNGVRDFIFGDDDNPYIRIGSGCGWNTFGSFRYPGSTLLTLTSIKLIATKDYSGTAYFRIFDYTNNNQIAYLTFINQTKQLYTISSFTNVPVNESIFELQGYVSNGYVKFYYFEIY